MPWFKVDDQFWSHPKVIELSSDAIALWVRAGSYAAQQLTDGRITVGALRMLTADRAVADELVLGGLWVQVDQRTWAFKDWHDYQPTSAEVEDRRAKRSAAGRKGADARWHGKKYADRMANAIANGSQTDAPSPSRTRDFFQDIQSQSSSTRARVSTDAIPITPMTKKLAAQQGIRDLRRIVDGAHRLLGLELDADQAYRVCLHLLGKANEHPRDATAYVLACFEGSTEEVRKFYHEEVA